MATGCEVAPASNISSLPAVPEATAVPFELRTRSAAAASCGGMRLGAATQDDLQDWAEALEAVGGGPGAEDEVNETLWIMA